MECNIITIQNSIKDVINTMSVIQQETIDINKMYWSTDANTQITGADDTDPVTLSTKLIKTEYVAGITFLEDLEDFFLNEAVTQTDYAQTCNKIKYGSAAAPVSLSYATESLGDRMYDICNWSLSLLKKCREIIDLYYDNEISDMMTNVDAQRTVSCGGLTRDQLNTGINLIEQFKKMMNNEVVTQADYAATISTWKRIGA